MNAQSNICNVQWISRAEMWLYKLQMSEKSAMTTVVEHTFVYKTEWTSSSIKIFHDVTLIRVTIDCDASIQRTKLRM